MKILINNIICYYTIVSEKVFIDCDFDSYATNFDNNNELFVTSKGCPDHKYLVSAFVCCCDDDGHPL